MHSYKIFVWKLERKRPLVRTRCRPVREDNIEMDLKEIGHDDVEWIHLAQNRDKWRHVVKTVMNLWAE
jgi:hypothetical protein